MQQKSLKLEEMHLPDIFHSDDIMIPPASSKNVKAVLIMINSEAECYIICLDLRYIPYITFHKAWDSSDQTFA